MNQQSGNAKCYILRDEKTIDNLESVHFDPDYWRNKPGYDDIVGGRGGSVKIEIEGQAALLRPYWRGGLVASFSRDQYLWLGISRTRAWREWHILHRALEASLPVPQPIGVCVSRNGLMYRAAIMTVFIENTETLSERLSSKILDQASWFKLGVLVKKMQDKGFRHADLNATNILIDTDENFYIIDFDKAVIRKQLGDWQWRTLYRLQRSLEKIDRQKQLHYRQDDWQAFMDGYQASL